MSTHQDDLVTIDAVTVTLKGTPEEVERLASAAGLYGEGLHPTPMTKDEDHIMTGVYIGLGVILAAGAGFLAWRYLLSDEQKARAVNATKDLVSDGLTAGRRAVRDARGRVHL